MKYRVRYLITARHDREAIKSHLKEFSTTAALRLFEKIKRKMEYVKINPYIYEVYERRPQFRRMVVEDYLVFYHVNNVEKIIEVHRILHGMMDIQKQVDNE